jgi:DNA-binding GntR family transcriptional regulator
MKGAALKPDVLNKQVYNLLKKDILQHRLKQGSRLVDSQLAEYYGISRTPIRDAIFMLIREGLLVNKGKRGFYVLQADAKDIDELYDLRLMIETHVLRTIITYNMKEQKEKTKEKLRHILKETDENIKKNQFVLSDESFHDSLIELLNNQRLNRIYEEIRNQMRVFRQMSNEVDQRVKYATETHIRIIEALLMEDLQKAESLLIEHLESGRKEAHLDFILEANSAYPAGRLQIKREET